MRVPSYLQFISKYFHAVGWSEESDTKSHKKQNTENNLYVHKYIKFKDRRKNNFMNSGMYNQPEAICLTLQHNLHCFVKYLYITH